MLGGIGDIKPERHPIEEWRVGQAQGGAGEKRARVENDFVRPGDQRRGDNGMVQCSILGQLALGDAVRAMKDLHFHAAGWFAACDVDDVY